MSRWRIVLPIVLLAVALPNMVRNEAAIADAWLPALLVLFGGAVLAFGVAYAMYRHRVAR
jgi:hypothetical protein